ncbi:MAG: zinc-ribbon domain-containing protein [Deltaproteobacteria bacterium]|nr:zinc-ribbon domain-containing protein [Deltaproteobacteria bacterium]
MLIRCPDCDREISSRAVTCPGCGAPIRSAVTIQATGRAWKATQLTGAAAAIAGITGVAIGPTDGISFLGGFPALGLASLSLFTGILVFIVGKIGAWWYHG